MNMIKLSRFEYKEFLREKGLKKEEIEGVLMRLQRLGRLPPHNPQQKLRRWD